MITEEKRVSPRFIAVKTENACKNLHFRPHKPSISATAISYFTQKYFLKKRDLLSGDHKIGSDDELHAGEILDGDVVAEANEAGEQSHKEAQRPFRSDVLHDLRPALAPPVLIEQLVLKNSATKPPHKKNETRTQATNEENSKKTGRRRRCCWWPDS